MTCFVFRKLMQLSLPLAFDFLDRHAVQVVGNSVGLNSLQSLYQQVVVYVNDLKGN